MEKQFISLLSRLVGINSINSTLSMGPGEGELAELILNYLRELNLAAEIQTIAPGRANVLAVLPGSSRERSILLNSHLDTVGVEGMIHPFTLRQEGDKLYGRGTYDMKGSVAIMLLLAEYFVKYPPPADILLTFVADEEDLSTGMEYLVNHWLKDITPRPSGAIFLEPTEEEIGVSHKGFNWYELEVFGKTAHGSRPEQGIDAILPLRSVLDELSRIQAELLIREPDPLLGHGSLHSSIIEGGTELSVIPGQSRLKWERRTLPGESQQNLDLELKRMVQAAENHPGDHEVRARELFVRLPHKVPDEARVLEHLQKASPQSQKVGLSFWADSALGAQAGIPSVLFGPIGHGAHAVDEWVSLKSLIRVYEVLKRLVESS
ncbi:Acetylornithine deacetylase (EC [Olavius sp. associated proteobacterium Delta 1]|nr:Acetylornithine deacetylase (EC [Olavius sp. associated proteobacterium Delta 1]